MRVILTIIFLLAFAVTSCGPKPQYKTHSGKKKMKYYNKQQFNHPDRDEINIKAMKKKNKK
jgi:hypothetical protein